MTNGTTQISRRDLFKGAALTLGTAAFLRTALAPSALRAQGEIGPGTLFSFSKGGVTFHTYVSPPQAVHVTSHIIEFDDEILLVDATMLPPTAAEVQGAIASVGKPVNTAIISHQHPDHWMGAPVHEGVTFRTLPEVADAIAEEAVGMDMDAPANIVGDMSAGTMTLGGQSVEFRHYKGNEAPHMLVTVLPDQKVAIVQDLVYNGVFFAPGTDRKNWIATLEELRDDPAVETLLVGHGMPTTRGELDNAIAYVKVLDDAMTNAATPDDAAAQIKAAYPGHTGEFLLGLIPEYWTR